MSAKAAVTKAIFIESREWRHVSAGNWYFSTAIHVDGVLAIQIGMTYGYGDQHLYNALRWLKANGHIPADTSLYEMSVVHGIIIYSTKSQVAKRDLFRDFQPDATK